MINYSNIITLMDMNVIISPCWYGVCDIYIAEGVLIWIRLYNECNDHTDTKP